MAGENNVIGLAMQLDVTDIKAGIKEVNKSIKSSKDEFNNATAGMDKWTKSSEGLNAKLKQLGTQLDGQKKIVAGYEAEIERVKNLEGDHSAELETLKGKLLNAQTAVKKTQSAMAHYKDTLKSVSKQEKEENSTLGKLQKTIADQKKKQADLTREYKNAVLQYGKNSKEAKALAKQLSTLSKEIDKNEGDVESADKAFSNLGKTVGDVAGRALEKSVKTFAKIGAAAAGVVGSFLATAEATRELRTNMGKVDTAFSEAGFSAEQAEKTYTDFYGVLGDEGQATEAVSHLAKLATSQQDLSKWTDICTGVYATFGDSLPIEGLTEAANETAKTGELTGGLADALNWAGINEDKFQDKLDKCNTEQERQALIQETLSKAYGSASAKYKETNKDIIAGQEAQAKLSQAMADVGAQAEPVMTKLKLIGAELLNRLSPVIDKMLPFVEEHLPAIGVAVGAVTTALGLLGAAVLAVKIKEAALTAATVAQTIATNAQAIATKVATAGQWLLNAALTANPIGAIIMAVTALIAVFVALWKNNEKFRDFFIGMWEKIKEFFHKFVEWFKANWKSLLLFITNPIAGVFKYLYDNLEGFRNFVDKIINAVKGFFTKGLDAIKKAWGGIGDWFSKKWNAIKQGASKLWNGYTDLVKKSYDKQKEVWSKVGSFFNGVFEKITGAFKKLPEKIKSYFVKSWENAKAVWDKVTSFFEGIISKITGAFKNLPSKMKEVGANLVKGLWNGIKDMTSWIVNKVKGFGENVLGGIKKFFGIHSPSKKMAEVGGYMAEGMAEGIEEGTDAVTEAGTKAGSGFAKGFNEAANEGLNEGADETSDAFGSLTSKLENQKEKLGKLESQYKSIVMQFGATSDEAYAMGKQILALSRDIETNELKVKDLDDSYQNLNGTLASQMRVELNNAKNRKIAIQEQTRQLEALRAEYGRQGRYSDAEAVGRQIAALSMESKQATATITELTNNLDYLAEQERKREAERKSSAKTSRKISNAAQKELNAYEQLVEKIKTQGEELEALKTQYESAVMTYGEASEEAANLANKISDVSKEIENNQKQVEELDKGYNALFAGTDNRKAWQKFVDNLEDALGLSENKLKAWADGVGKYISKIADHMDKIINTISDLFSSIGDYFDAKVEQRIEEIDAAIEKLNETNDAEVASAKDSANEQLSIVNEMFKKEQISAKEYRDKKMKIENEIAAFTKKKNDEAAAQEKKLLREKDAIARKQFAAKKANDIASAVINGATAILKGFAELGPIGGAINTGVQAGITATQIAMIAKQQYVPMLARGGIADGATLAMIGEAGKEAVLPLERNTGWIETLAEKLNAVMQKDMLGGLQAGVPAYAMAGGQTVVNNYYNQTINSPKALTRREIYRDSKNLLSLKG